MLILVIGLVSAIGRVGSSGSGGTVGGTGTSPPGTAAVPPPGTTAAPVTEAPPPPAQYALTVNCTGATHDFVPSTISSVDTLTLTFSAMGGYMLPDTVTVTGASHTWDSSTGQLILSQAAGAVTVTITAEHDYPYLEVGQSCDPRIRAINIYEGSNLILSKNANEPGFYHLDLTGSGSVKVTCDLSSNYTYFIVYNGETEVFRSTWEVKEYTIPTGTEWTHVYFVDDN